MRALYYKLKKKRHYAFKVSGGKKNHAITEIKPKIHKTFYHLIASV